MDKKLKIAIAVIAVIIIAIIAALFLIGNSEKTLQGTGAKVTLPSDYEIDYTKGIATKDDKIILFNGIIGNTSLTTDFYKAISENGKEAGYEDISEDTINNFKVYKYSTKPSNLKTVSYGSLMQWVEYPPVELVDSTGQKIEADHYKKIYYISPNNSTANELTIIAKKPDTDLNTDEITKIINSISLNENQN